MAGRKTLDIDLITLRTIRAINPIDNSKPPANYVLTADGLGNATWNSGGSTGTGTVGPTGATGTVGPTGAIGPTGAAGSSSVMTENFTVGFRGDWGGAARAIYSYDGLQWISSSLSTFQAQQVAWNGILWVAVGFDTSNATTIITSSNGIDWTPSITNPFVGRSGNGIAWNGTFWIAVGVTVSNVGSIATSNDGLTWTLVGTNPFGSGGDGRSIAWNGSYWIAVGLGATDSIIKSTDGVNWTPSTNNPFSGGYGQGIAWNGAYWVATGLNALPNTAGIARSTDGLNWTNISNPFGSFGVGQAVAWNGSLWVAVGGNGSVSSLDGITWTAPLNNLFASGELRSVTWNGARWIVSGYNSSFTLGIATSIDGRTWTASTDSLALGQCTSVSARQILPYVAPIILSQLPLGSTGAALIIQSPTGTNNLYYSRFLNVIENGGTGTMSVNGNLTITGALSKGSGAFLIPHPNPALKDTHMLRHCFVEAPTRGDNLYRWILTTTNRVYVQLLPTYSPFLNEGWQFFVQAINGFGQGYCVLASDEGSFCLQVSEDGIYNVLGIATRKDAIAKAFFDEKGVEFTA